MSDPIEEAAKANFEACLDDIRRGGGDVPLTWEGIPEEMRQVWRDDVHRPHRDDEIARWLKAKRDAEKDCWGETEHYRSFDLLLDEYRLRADTGLLLHEDIALAGEHGGE